MHTHIPMVHTHIPMAMPPRKMLILHDAVDAATSAHKMKSHSHHLIAVLLDRHGLADIPDNAATLTEGPP